MRTTHHDRHRCAQNADHLTHNRPFSAFFAEVVCTLGTIPPQTVISPSPNGGNGVIRDPTRRRHAASQFLMLQNPHRRREGIRATGVPPDAGPDCGTCARRSRPRHPWTAARPGRASRRRTEPYVSTPNAAGVEGAKGICRCARGRWRGLSGLRGDAPNHTSVDQAPPVWRAPEGPEGTGGLRDRPLRAAGSRVAISRAAGPDGTRNTSGTTSKTISQVARRPRAHQAARPQHTLRRMRTRHLAQQNRPAPSGPGGSGGSAGI